MTKAVTRNTGMLPSVLDEWVQPWNEWFNKGSLWGNMLTVPAVNIGETSQAFELRLAVPGMQKDDFVIDVEGNLLTISCEKEESKETKADKLTRQEYNYTSFSRTFTLPDVVKQEDIEALYENGILTLVLPKVEEAKKTLPAKHITVK